MVKAAQQQAQQTLSNYDVAVVASVRPFARDIAELREGEAEEKECCVEELPAFRDFLEGACNKFTSSSQP